MGSDQRLSRSKSGGIIDLATDEHAMALEDALVQAALVGR